MLKVPTIKTILADLVAMPSVTHDTAESLKALDYIDDFLTMRGMYVNRFIFDGYGALVATSRPTKTPKIMLVGHIDVVPASSKMFTMAEDGDTITGRGVFDMKSALAGYMLAVDHFKDNLGAYDFGIMITSDEETHDLGVKRLLREGYCPKEAAILFDGARDWQIEKLAKGALYIDLSITDKTGHGSRPWLVDSASVRMVKLLAKIEALFEDAGPNTSTLNIASINAGIIGKAHNQIPATAKAGLDIRLISEADRKRLGAAIQQLCEQFGATYELFAEFPVLNHDMNNRHMRAFAKSIEKITGLKSNGVVSYGASDAVHFLARGISCIVTWPIGGGHHGEDEWIDVKALSDITPIITDYIGSMARTTASVIVERSTVAH